MNKIGSVPISKEGLPLNNADGLSPIADAEWDKVIALARGSYAPAVRQKVEASLSFHRECKAAGLDDGRRFFAWRERGDIAGVCGVQTRPEDPAVVAWASWFFVIPGRRRSAVGYRMSYALRIWLRLKGFKRMYIETTDSRTYYNIDSMLRKTGFQEVTRIRDFFEPGIDNIIFEGHVEVLSRRVSNARKSLLPIFIEDEFGLYCDYPIRRGETILQLSGPCLSAPTYSSIQIGPDKHIEDGIGRYINHHCNPNAAVTAEAAIVASCDIEAGSEITFDYNAAEDRLSRQFTCRCCGKLIAGRLYEKRMSSE